MWESTTCNLTQKLSISFSFVPSLSLSTFKTLFSVLSNKLSSLSLSFSLSLSHTHTQTLLFFDLFIYLFVKQLKTFCHNLPFQENLNVNRYRDDFSLGLIYTRRKLALQLSYVHWAFKRLTNGHSFWDVWTNWVKISTILRLLVCRYFASLVNTLYSINWLGSVQLSLK